PKVDGAWNLHKTLSSETLDFFSFSLFGAMFGQWGQANYCAPNTFVDPFVSNRHSLGLPASTINIGLQAAASHISQESGFLECAELMLMRPGPIQQQQGQSRFVQPSQIGFGFRSTLPIASPRNRVVFRKDPRMLVYRNLEADTGWSSAPTTHAQAGADPADEELARFLRGAAAHMAVLHSDEAAALLARDVGRTLFGFMPRPEDEFDVHTPMADVGIDSLVSIELRNWIRKRLGVEMNVL
ncbi:KR domain-containing protein, partial [Colletotrichum navitas]